MTRNFGIELEFKGLRRWQSLDALNAAGIKAQKEDYNHSDHTDGTWKIISDASVMNGHEVVSPILSGEEGLKEAMHAANALESAGATIDKACGLHVHFNATDLSADEIRMICTRYMKHESEIDAFMPKSRRDSNNTFCRSTRLCFADNRRFETARNARELANSVSGRYYKVNLQAYLAHHTIEFRQHSGTVDAQKIACWVRFLDGFITESIKLAHLKAAMPQLQPAQQNLLDLIREENDAGRLQHLLGLQPHSLRGAISILRKKGLEIVSRRESGMTFYRWVSNTAMQIEDRLFNGVEQEVADFYTARAIALAV